MKTNQQLRDAYGVALNEVLDQVDRIATQVPQGGVQVSAVTLRHLELESHAQVTGHARVTFHVGSSAVVAGTEQATVASPDFETASPMERKFRKNLDR